MVKYDPSSLDPVGTTLLPTESLVLFPGITKMYLRKAHQVASFPTWVSISNPQYNVTIPSMCCKHYPETDWKRHQYPWPKQPLWKCQIQCQPRLCSVDIFKPSAVRCQCNIYLHIEHRMYILVWLYNSPSEAKEM